MPKTKNSSLDNQSKVNVTLSTESNTYIFKNISGYNFGIRDGNREGPFFHWFADKNEGEILYDVPQVHRDIIYRKRNINGKRQNYIEAGFVVELNDQLEVISGETDEGKHIRGFDDKTIMSIAKLSGKKFAERIDDIDNFNVLDKLMKVFAENNFSSKNFFYLKKHYDKLKEKKEAELSLLN